MSVVGSDRHPGRVGAPMDPLARRRFLEAWSHETWLTRGRRHRVHPEHLRAFPWIVEGCVRGAGLWARGMRNARSPVVEHLPLAVDRLPPGLEGLRVLHLSDLHLDGVPGLASAVVDLLRGVRADVGVITGDYPYEAGGWWPEVSGDLRRVLDACRPQDGWLAVLGNHDRLEHADGLRALGVEVLMNRGRAVHRGRDVLWVAGVDDPHWFECDDLPAALAGRPRGAFTTLLAHTADLWSEAEAAGVGLYLCGHTHGGQIRFPVVGAPFLDATYPRRFASGSWRVGGMHGRTSRGLGCSMVPVRFLCPPEVTVLELRRAPGR